MTTSSEWMDWTEDENPSEKVDSGNIDTSASMFSDDSEDLSEEIDFRKKK